MTKSVVLLVEDDINDVFLMRRAFGRTGFDVKVDSAEDGEDAVVYLSRCLDSAAFPDLVILDIKLPKMSGLEVLSWIRQHPALSRIPVVMLTASSEQSDMKRAADLGVARYAPKPGRFLDLANLVKSIAEKWLADSAPGRADS